MIKPEASRSEVAQLFYDSLKGHLKPGGKKTEWQLPPRKPAKKKCKVEARRHGRPAHKAMGRRRYTILPANGGCVLQEWRTPLCICPLQETGAVRCGLKCSGFGYVRKRKHGLPDNRSLVLHCRNFDLVVKAAVKYKKQRGEKHDKKIPDSDDRVMSLFGEL